jgi:hypothetical protein
VSELQLALAAAGVAVIAAVWGYNHWQERKHRRLAEAAFAPTGSADVLATATEPPASEDRREPAMAEERREPVIDAAPAADAALALPLLPEAWADEMADCVVRIHFAEPIAAARLWAAQAEWAGQLQRPLQWLGLDPILQMWRQLGSGDNGRYGIVCVAMQLADRRGAVSEAEVATFLAGLQALLQEHDAVAALPDADDVLIRARAVDDACIAVDMQLALNLVPANGRPFDGAALRHALEQAAFILGEDGIFRPAADDSFSLGPLGGGAFDEFAENALEHGMTLTLDVPRVADGLVAFDRLLALVGELSEKFDCALVDAQRNALAAEAVAAIRSRIADLQGQMAQRRIAPGGVRARRLFS